jgi:8-oxo-(d)GTP phosphatase
VPLILVRHGSAGDRSDWEGDDRERPLDDRGQGQAHELVLRLAPFPVDAIYSSPARRCVETVEPLAGAHGLAVIECGELGEERQSAEGGRLLRSLAAKNVVVCGHGGLEQALHDPRKWRKGAAFVLDERLRIVAEV